MDILYIYICNKTISITLSYPSPHCMTGQLPSSADFCNPPPHPQSAASPEIEATFISGLRPFIGSHRRQERVSTPAVRDDHWRVSCIFFIFFSIFQRKCTFFFSLLKEVVVRFNVNILRIYIRFYIGPTRMNDARGGVRVILPTSANKKIAKLVKNVVYYYNYRVQNIKQLK